MLGTGDNEIFPVSTQTCQKDAMSRTLLEPGKAQRGGPWVSQLEIREEALQ